jgi:hypothetical protein
MTGKQLVLNAMKCKAVSRIPWVPFVGCHAAYLLDKSAEDYFKSAELIHRGALLADELYRPDGLPAVFDLQVEAEALGCAVQFSKKNPPAVMSHPLEANADLNGLKVPNGTEGRYPVVMDAARRIVASLGDKIAIYGLITGPLTLGLHLRGTDIFFDMIDNPEYVKELMAFCAKVCVKTAQLYIEAGVDIIDCALSPFALASSQPATEAMIAALEGNERDTGLSKEKLFPIADHFRGVKKQLAETFHLNTNIEIDTKVLSFQIPGGMLSNLLNQMKEQGMADKFPELIEEMPKVRAELGYPPLVTPTSQIVGSMSAFNVMLGRYKVVPREVKDLARGKYGRTPAPIDPEFLQSLIGDDELITYRPADDIEPQMATLRQQLAEKGYPNASTEDVLSYAVFPDVALKFFEANRK